MYWCRDVWTHTNTVTVTLALAWYYTLHLLKDVGLNCLYMYV